MPLLPSNIETASRRDCFVYRFGPCENRVIFVARSAPTYGKQEDGRWQ